MPRLQIRDPLPHSKVNGSAGVLTWKTSFERFDGKPYAPDFPSDFDEPETDLVYAVYFSLDEGKTWYSAIDGELADPGKRPEASGLLWDTMSGDESFAVNFGEHQIPNGDILLRVVCHDNTRILHSSHHQVRVTVQK